MAYYGNAGKEIDFVIGKELTIAVMERFKEVNDSQVELVKVVISNLVLLSLVLHLLDEDDHLVEPIVLVGHD